MIIDLAVAKGGVGGPTASGYQIGLLLTAIVSALIAAGSLTVNALPAARRRRRSAERILLTVEVRVQARGVHLPGEALVRLVNGSDEVITDIRAAIDSPAHVGAAVGPMANNNHPGQAAFILPGAETMVRVIMDDSLLQTDEQGHPLLPEWLDPDLRIRVRWRDASGHYWSRVNNLRPITTPWWRKLKPRRASQ